MTIYSELQLRNRSCNHNNNVWMATTTLMYNREMDGMRWQSQMGLETHLHLKPRYVFFCTSFKFTNKYLQCTTPMMMTTMTRHHQNHHHAWTMADDDGQQGDGREETTMMMMNRAWDTSVSQAQVFFYFYLIHFISILLTTIYSVPTKREWKQWQWHPHTPTPPTPLPPRRTGAPPLPMMPPPPLHGYPPYMGFFNRWQTHLTGV